jgi:starvation-inducible outer membrane lipoprotein
MRLATVAIVFGAAIMLSACSSTPQTMMTTTQQTTSQVVPGQTTVTVSKTQQSP